MNQKQLVYDTLTGMKIPFQSIEHRAVFTVEEMQSLNFPAGSRIAKNLFLRDAKGKRHFLVVADADQPVDLKQMEQVLASAKLSFASEERLQKHLGLTKGSVSPFGLINDRACSVEVYLDEKLQGADRVAVHPNDNTATVFITFDDLLQFISSTEHKVNLINFADK